MATYASPSGAVIRDYTKLNGAAYGITDGALETLLAASVDDGETVLFLRIGDSYETDSSLTARQVVALQMAVSFRTAIVYLRELLFDVVSGTYEPLLVGSPDDIRELIAEYEAIAVTLEELVMGAGVNAGPSTYALPSVGSSTFVYSSSDRSPYNRNRLLDETDNISSSDLVAG